MLWEEKRSNDDFQKPFILLSFYPKLTGLAISRCFQVNISLRAGFKGSKNYLELEDIAKLEENL